MYYKGCLQKTMKEFDSCLKGKPFTFRVGQGEVIKGWDNGVEGIAKHSCKFLSDIAGFI